MKQLEGSDPRGLLASRLEKDNGADFDASLKEKVVVSLFSHNDMKWRKSGISDSFLLK